VAVGEQAHYDAINDLLIPDNDFRDLLLDASELFLKGFYLLINRSVHFLTSGPPAGP
jgi:hypothetical protein